MEPLLLFLVGVVLLLDGFRRLRLYARRWWRVPRRPAPPYPPAPTLSAVLDLAEKAREERLSDPGLLLVCFPEDEAKLRRVYEQVVPPGDRLDVRPLTIKASRFVQPGTVYYADLREAGPPGQLPADYFRPLLDDLRVRYALRKSDPLAGV